MENQEFNQQAPKRPVFLTVLSILSFITIGFGILGSLLGFITGKLSPEQMEQIKVDSAKQIAMFQDQGMDEFSNTFEQLFSMQEYINANFYLHNLVNLAALILGLLGVIYMLKGLKKGFHMYIIYNICMVLIYYVSVPIKDVPTFIIIINLIFSGLFIFLYSRNMKWFTK